MTGTGAPGSHSALFGLTPDGHKETESSSVTTAPKPSAEDSKQEAMGGGKEGADTGGSREQDRSEGVADQIHDPKVAEKGHDGGPIEGTGKPTSEA